MDDKRTNQMLDSLAELFLTGTGGHAQPRPRNPVHEQLDGPAPIRLSPKVASQAAPPRVPPGGPRLRMTESPDAFAPDPTAAGARIELVFLGSLPGFAGPWLTQYAQRRANDDGPVGVLHVDGDQVDIELVGRADDALPSMPLTGNDLVATLRHLSDVQLWLISLASPADNPAFAMFDRVERWTILTGCDEPAVYGASELIRTLLEAEADHSPTAVDRHIGVMAMGSDLEAGERAIDTINASLNAIIEQPVQLLGAIRQMAPVKVRIVGSFDAIPELWTSALDAMLQMDEPSAPPVTVRAPRRLRAKTHATPAAQETATPQAAPTPHDPAPRQEAPQTIQGEPDLSTYLPGSVALQARCPRHADTQLVLDEAGCLHLLRRHSGDAATLHAAVIDLIEARAWVHEHVELLKLTQRQCRFDAAADPVLHLFTDQARLATALVSRLGRFVRLHLFQRIETAGISTWFCAELN